MAQQNIPSQPAIRTIEYRNLLGVDYQRDPVEVDRRHSPDMINMISDEGGNPVKRYGYRRIGKAYEDIIRADGKNIAFGSNAVDDKYNLYFCEVNVDEKGELDESGKSYFLTSGGTRMKFDAFTASYSIVNDFIFLTESLWGWRDSLEHKWRPIGVAKDNIWSPTYWRHITKPNQKFIPTVATLYKPNGMEMVNLPAGTDITGATQGVNILTPWRSVEYCVTTETASESNFTIPGCKKVCFSTVEVYSLDPDTYEWVRMSSITLHNAKEYYCRAIDGKENTTIRTADNIVTFTSPYESITVGEEPKLVFASDHDKVVPAGVPNIKITYVPFDMTDLNADDGGTSASPLYKGIWRDDRCDIYKSKVTAMVDARLFVAVGSRIYYSRVNNPFMMDDNFYFDVDNEVVSITGTSGGIAIITKDNGNNTIYIARGEYSEEDAMMVYSIKASSARVGAITGKVSGTLNDEPLFLASTGIYGLTNNYYSEKYSVQRSGKINKRLCSEPDLEKAVGVSFNNYFYLAVNGHMYVLDGRHRDQSRNGDSSYECYFFDNMPQITAIYVLDLHMYFSDGEYTYTWSNELTGISRYLDNAVHDDEQSIWKGTPVKARWCSPVDDDGALQYYKVLNKKGTIVTLAPSLQASCDVTIVKDQNERYYVGKFNGSVFKISDGVSDAFTKKKIKKYKRLQFVVEHNDPEPFGLISVIKSFTLGNYAKR